jgi:erythromycin esterase
MGLNLIWLANERFAGRRIIVWAATFHIVRNIEMIELLDNSSGFTYDGAVTMGGVAADRLGDDMYMLGFTAYSGSAGTWFNAPRALSLPFVSSLEWMFNEARFADAFLDLRNPPAGGEWLQSPNIMRPLGYTQMTAVWPRHLDGIIYNGVMAPSTRHQ